MELIVLGTTAPFNKEGTACPGYLLSYSGRYWLLDCGSGIQPRLMTLCDLKDLIAIVLTHLHKDHITDIWPLGNAFFNKMKKHKTIEQPIRLYLPSEPKLEFADIVLGRDCFSAIPIEEDLTIDENGMRITFCRTDHPYPCYAVKFEAGGKKFVYTGDTRFTESLVGFAMDADLLLCEAGILAKEQRPNDDYHLQTREVAQLAAQANVKKLMLTHFHPDNDPVEYLDEVYEYLGEVLDVSLDVVIAEEMRMYEV